MIKEDKREQDEETEEGKKSGRKFGGKSRLKNQYCSTRRYQREVAETKIKANKSFHNEKMNNMGQVVCYFLSQHANCYSDVAETLGMVVQD